MIFKIFLLNNSIYIIMNNQNNLYPIEMNELKTMKRNEVWKLIKERYPDHGLKYS